MAERHRERVLQDEVATTHRTWYRKYPYGTCTTSPGGSQLFSESTGSRQVVHEFETMDDFVTPHFEKLCSEGRIINNPMLKTSTYKKDTGFMASVSKTVEIYGCTPKKWYPSTTWIVTDEQPRALTVTASPGLFTTSDIDSMRDIVSAKTYSKIGQTDVLLAVTAMEMQKTVVGLTDILRKVHNIYQGLNYADLKFLRKHLSPAKLKDIYMNARYNLRPLYYEAKGLYGVYNAEKETPPRQTFRSVYSDSKFSSTSFSISFDKHTYQPVGERIHGIDTVYDQFRLRSGVLTDVLPQSLEQRLGLTDVATSLWELIPLSFVVDWFCTMGDFVRSWVPVIGFKTLASWYVIERMITTKRIANTLVEDRSSTSSTVRYTGYSTSFSSGVSEIIVKTKERIPVLERPSMPQFNVNLDPLKLLDLAFILGSLRKAVRLKG